MRGNGYDAMPEYLINWDLLNVLNLLRILPKQNKQDLYHQSLDWVLGLNTWQLFLAQIHI